VPSLFGFDPFLEARAEIRKLFCSFFSSNENKKTKAQGGRGGQKLPILRRHNLWTAP
jgi:hypothetical protein